MATTKDIDILKSGPMTFRQLQNANDNLQTAQDPDFEAFMQSPEMTFNPISLYDARMHAQTDFESPISQQETHMGDKDYWGRSVWDTPNVTGEQLDKLGDVRAENQPWWSKIINGVSKAPILAITTAAESAGLLYGIGDAIINGETHRVWDNPITNFLKAANDLAEDAMPNYYTQDEMEHPLSHMFNANWIGDKFIKNIGFMVGAYYGMGVPVASGVGKLGKFAAKAAKTSGVAEAQGMARRVGELTAKYGDDVAGLNKALETAHLTPMERAAQWTKATDKVRNIAQGTRTASQWAGSIGSAVNEGAIEAINNSRDWMNAELEKENARYEADLQSKLSVIDSVYGDTEEGAAKKAQIQSEADLEHNKILEEIEKGRTRMGNADFLLNIPILTASNFVELGKLYSRGFNSTRRQLGDFMNHYSVPGQLAQHNLKSDKTWKKGVAKALLINSTEGAEEYFQKAASDGAGNAVSESINRYRNAGGTEEAKNTIGEYITGFAKSSLENLGEEGAWDEALVGFLSATVGMPTFGRQNNQNAVLGKDKMVGLSGGFFGAYNDYMDQKKQEDKVSEYLNQRVQDPGFKAMYKKLLIDHDYNALLNEAISDNDKEEHKTLLGEQMFMDLNAIASANKLAEFKEMIGYTDDYTDNELLDVLKLSSYATPGSELKKRDQEELNRINVRLGSVAPLREEIDRNGQRINELIGLIDQAATPEEKQPLASEHNKLTQRNEELSNQIEAIEKNHQEQGVPDAQEEKDLKEQKTKLEEKLEKSKTDNTVYADTVEGSLIDANGDMTISEEGREKAREVLKRNRDNYLKAIDTFLKVRNDIDIETDGRLEDKDIAELSFLKYQILDMESRSADMADEFINGLIKGDNSLKNLAVQASNNQKEKVKDAQEAYNNAVAARDAAKKAGKDVAAKETAVQAAAKKLANEKFRSTIADNAVKLLEKVLQDVDITEDEKRGLNKGYGTNESGKTFSEEYENKRKLNADELSAYLKNPLNAAFLKSMLVNLNVSNQEKEKYTQMIADLGILADKQVAYNKALRKAIKDPSYLNEISEQHQKKLSEEEKGNKINELSLGLRGAKNLVELDNVFRGAQSLSPEIAEAAMKKAIDEGNDVFKAAAKDYTAARTFDKSFRELLKDIQDPALASQVEDTLNEEWNNSLNKEEESFYNSLIDGIKAAAKFWKDSGTPEGKTVSEAISKILKDLEEANVTTSTNNVSQSGTAKPKANARASRKNVSLKDRIINDMNKKQSLEALDKWWNNPDTKEDLQSGELTAEDKKNIADAYNAKVDELKKKGESLSDKEIAEKITEEVAIAFSKGEQITQVKQLSNDLRTKISLYNDAHPDDKFEDKDVQKVLLVVSSEEEINMEEDDSSQETSAERSMFSEEMKFEVRTSFESSTPQTLPNNVYIGTGGVYARGKMPYKPSENDPLHDLIVFVQSVLGNNHAQDFLDHNLLGYMNQWYDKKDQNIPVYFLRSTSDDAIAKDTIFMAVEIEPGKNGREGVEKYLNGKVGSIAGVSRFITIPDTSGKMRTYQIVGVLDVFKDAEQGIKDAYDSLVEALNVEFELALSDGNLKNNEFVASTLTSHISKIFTGRLEEVKVDQDTGQGNDSPAPINDLSDVIAESKDSVEEMAFGVCVNGKIETSKAADKWRVDPTHPSNGAIYLYVPRPNGASYPLRCVRKTARSWYTSGGEDMLDKVLSGELDNKYLKSIVTQLKTMLNSNKDVADRLKAKETLCSIMCFKGLKISFESYQDAVTFTVGNSLPISVEVEDGDFNKAVKTIFSAVFAKEDTEDNFKFSVPADSKSMTKDIILADVLSVRLAGYYNFNSDFTVVPIDGDGKEIGKPEGGVKPAGSTNYRMATHTANVGYGKKEYNFKYDDKGNVVEVSAGGKALDATKDGDEINHALIAYYVSNGKKEAEDYYSAAQYLLDNKLLNSNDLSEEVKKAIGEALAGKYIIWHGSDPYLYEANAVSKLTKKKLEELTKIAEVAMAGVANVQPSGPLQVVGKGKQNKNEEKKGKEVKSLTENKILTEDDVTAYDVADAPEVVKLLRDKVKNAKRQQVIYDVLRALEASGVNFENDEFKKAYDDCLSGKKDGRDRWNQYVNEKVCS